MCRCWMFEGVVRFKKWSFAWMLTVSFKLVTQVVLGPHISYWKRYIQLWQSVFSSWRPIPLWPCLSSILDVADNAMLNLVPGHVVLLISALFKHWSSTQCACHWLPLPPAPTHLLPPLWYWTVALQNLGDFYHTHWEWGYWLTMLGMWHTSWHPVCHCTW